MDRIQKVSSYILVAFTVLLIGLPLVEVLKWLYIETEFVKNVPWPGFLGVIPTPEGPVDLRNVPWTTVSKSIGFLASLIGLLPMYGGLFLLKSIFKNYQKGDIFIGDNARSYRLVGWMFILNAFLIKPLNDGLMVLSVTLSNPPGHRMISFGFGTPNLEAIFCGFVVIVISWVMLEASRLREEQEYTI